MSRQVLLVPGLWMPALALRYLAAQLASQGFAARVFAYRGRGPFDANVEQLARFASAATGAPPHLVGHSLGGVLILETLRRHASLPVASAVLLGAPVRGCQAGRRFARSGVGRWMMGASRGLWEEREAAWPRAEPLGVIAGTVPIGLGRLLGRPSGPNDGVVCVSETVVHGMTEQALVALGHSSLLFSRRVARLVARFLVGARFS